LELGGGQKTERRRCPKEASRERVKRDQLYVKRDLLLLLLLLLLLHTHTRCPNEVSRERTHTHTHTHTHTTHTHTHTHTHTVGSEKLVLEPLLRLCLPPPRKL
jgi:hypothetical protein